MFTGKDIRAKRENEGLSAPKLAKLLGTTKENVYKWESGTVPRDLKDRTNIENWLKNDTFPKIGKDAPITKKGNTKKINTKKVDNSDWQKKYYDLLEKYTALLERNN